MRIKVLTGMLDGPYRDEADFKRAYISYIEAMSTETAVFCIETEETEPGFPDLVTASIDCPAVFTEMKYIREDGKLHFRKGQPKWYKTNSEKCLIQILAWDSRSNHLLYFNPDDIVEARSLTVPVPEFPYGKS